MTLKHDRLELLESPSPQAVTGLESIGELIAKNNPQCVLTFIVTVDETVGVHF
jgi:hypothetical protein